MVTKKQRRRELARAGAERRRVRAARRQARRRTVQLVGACLLVLAAVTALVVWIAVHDGESGSTAAAGYHAGPVAPAATPTPEVKP